MKFDLSNIMVDGKPLTSFSVNKDVLMISTKEATNEPLEIKQYTFEGIIVDYNQTIEAVDHGSATSIVNESNWPNVGMKRKVHIKNKDSLRKPFGLKGWGCNIRPTSTKNVYVVTRTAKQPRKRTV